jgi:hypothetical protein
MLRLRQIPLTLNERNVQVNVQSDAFRSGVATGSIFAIPTRGCVCARAGCSLG